MRVGYRLAAGLGALLILLTAAWGARKAWRLGGELRRPVAEAAVPGPLHREADCAAAVRGPRAMVALVLGQSNSANHAQTRAAGGPGVYSWYEGRCFEALDPLPGASGDQGSLWTRLGRQLIEGKHFDSVVFVTLGITSTSVSQWAHHPRLVQRLRQSARSLATSGLAVTHVLWYQGEADSFKSTSAEAYRQDFGIVLARLRASAIGAPVWVATATLCQKRQNPLVRRVQRELPQQLPGLRPGPDMDALFGPAHRYNGCHFGHDSVELAAAAWRRSITGE